MEIIIKIIIISAIAISFFLASKLEWIKFKKNKNDKKSYWTICITNRWEEVKSKAENEIANFLDKYNINYIYENDLIVDWNKVANPDFYLPDYDLWIEFWWLMDNVQYKIKRKYKRKKFDEYKLSYIDLYRSNVFSKYWFFENRLKKTLIKKSKEKGIEIKELI